MTAAAEPLFLPGWEVEPCDTAPPPAVPPARRRRRVVGTQEPHTLGRRVRTIRVKGDLL